MTNCTNCIFMDVYDTQHNIYNCALLSKLKNSPVVIDMCILNGIRNKFICPYFCSKENTINVFCKVHKRQFAKADLESLYKKVYGGYEINED